MLQEKKLIRISKIFSLLLLIYFFALPKFVAAADFSLSPISGVVVPGTSFNVDVSVSNNNQAINAVSGTVSFPTDLLSVKSISKDNSIIKMWATDPSFSNTEGKVHFEGVIFNPGFSGNKGTILRIAFTPKRTGKAQVLFSDGSILANDGLATNITGQLGSASFIVDTNSQVTSPETTTPVTTSATENPLLPLAPKIQSVTNPDPNKWYNKDQPSFTWQLPADVTAIRTLYGNSPTSIPEHEYAPAISNKILGVVDDGVYYFHAQYRNAHGLGPITHFRFQIDTKAPLPFLITFPAGNETDNPTPLIDFRTTDNLSGVDHYNIRIDNVDIAPFVPSSASSTYMTPSLNPGKHTVVVKAEDKAGNATIQSADFIVDAIDAPKITDYSREIEEGDILQVKGTSYPNATVTVYLKDRGGKIDDQSAETDSTGTFSLTWTKAMETGTYSMSSIVTDRRGAKSQSTLPVTIVVNQKAIFRIGGLVVNYLAIGIIILSAIAGLIAFCWFLVSRLLLLKRKIRNEISDTEALLHKNLKILREEVHSNIELLQNTKNDRSLTKEESIVLKSLNKRIDSIEKELERKLEGIKKDTK